ncbi:MAG: PASTA domain-containing protein, partial [Balneolaceae bacterium]
KGLSKTQAEEVLNSLNLPYSISGKTGYISQQIPQAGDSLSGEGKILLTLSETYLPTDSANVKEGYSKIPELRGMNMRQATALLTNLGLEATLIGSGTIFAQFPKSGELLKKGNAVTIRGKAKSLEILTEAGKR